MGVLERGVGVLDLRCEGLIVAGDCVADREVKPPTSHIDFHFLLMLVSIGSPTLHVKLFSFE